MEANSVAQGLVLFSVGLAIVLSRHWMDAQWLQIFVIVCGLLISLRGLQLLGVIGNHG